MANETFMIAKSGLPREVLEAWREDFLAGKRSLAAYMAEIGANGVFQFSQFDKPSSFRFPRNQQPDGWTKPSRNGASRPKKSNVEAINRLAAVEWAENLSAVVSRDLSMPSSVAGEKEDGSKFSSALGISPLGIYSACWAVKADGTADDVILIGPDIAAAAEKYAGQNATWSPDGTEPVVPEGFKLVTASEVDLLFAEAKVARERYKAEQKKAPEDEGEGLEL